jgi:hypothetical protein
MTRQTVVFPRIFDLPAYALLLPDLTKACAQGDEIRLDFAGTERAYPDGMVPLVATLMHIRSFDRFDVEVVPPRAEPLSGVFEGVGWAEALRAEDAQFSSLPDRTTQFTPLRPFTRTELGPLHKSMMEVLVRQVSLAPFVADAAHWALWEVMDNVLNHSEEPMGWVQAATFRQNKHLNIVVADSGIGIQSSLGERYPELSEREAIRRAVEKGETRDPSRYQGNGLHGCRDMAIQNGGQLTVVSGEWMFVQEGLPRSGKVSPPLRRYLPLAARHRGTVVELMLRTNRPVDLQKALGPHLFVSLLELAHSVSGEYVFLVSRESGDVGTREAGRRLRNKVANLSRARETARIVLDFAGIDMVSSSFADEFVAKLARQLGRGAWSTRFELRNMNPSVGTIVQIALWHRLH